MFEEPQPSAQQLVDAGWRAEALFVLVWAIGLVDELPPANQQADTALFQELLPPFAEVSAEAIISQAKRRSDAELLEMADVILKLHWEARDAKYRLGRAATHVEIEIIQERHHAINWVIGYDGVAWDDITTDT